MLANRNMETEMAPRALALDSLLTASTCYTLHVTLVGIGRVCYWEGKVASHAFFLAACQSCIVPFVMWEAKHDASSNAPTTSHPPILSVCGLRRATPNTSSDFARIGTLEPTSWPAAPRLPRSLVMSSHRETGRCRVEGFEHLASNPPTRRCYDLKACQLNSSLAIKPIRQVRVQRQTLEA